MLDTLDYFFCLDVAARRFQARRGPDTVLLLVERGSEAHRKLVETLARTGDKPYEIPAVKDEDLDQGTYSAAHDGLVFPPHLTRESDAYLVATNWATARAWGYGSLLDEYRTRTSEASSVKPDEIPVIVVHEASCFVEGVYACGIPNYDYGGLNN
jgi:hypothetical protein